ncbi:ATP-binding cassette domain-containing protein [candidate division KSB3 bacterium]|uniref:ATP-binding cassette domain-containing protein n=1 Tax=candidate division KSB3 bacterium TaxID=2044937 RepID=A0A9D5JZQ6_9BACT|nr:ATP-binding cassette domain-containing protein [candidate division KSB3 bacterium]MBD3327339.1 ATP-binding cassette domain-containing protein [candidate division KSB3 bacterium]
MLDVKNVRVCYGNVPAIHHLDLVVPEGSITSIVGSNGAGKTTLLKTIMGHLRPTDGEIRFQGTRIDGLPAHQISRQGIALVPEGRRLFEKLTVRENLLLGAYAVKDKAQIAHHLDWVYALFPILKERQHQVSGTFSGGEQQLLAIARGLMSQPSLLMFDEPSLGVMPTVVTQIFEIIERINQEGTTILLVEQNVERSLNIAEQAYVLQTGRIVLQGSGTDLLQQDLIREAYLGM